MIELKVKDGFILKEIAGSYIVVPLRERIQTFSAVVNLNETGAFLWKALQKDVTKDELIKAMTDEYDIDSVKAEADIVKFIDKLEKEGLLETR